MTEPSSATDPIRSTLADDSDFAELLREFTETIPQKRQNARALQQLGSVDELRVLAHQLKGTGGGYGFPGLSDVAADLEQTCDTRDAASITRAVDRLVDYLNLIEA
jgi:HPt (histidine-containing phosphotransfer) domain-containing protein